MTFEPDIVCLRRFIKQKSFFGTRVCHAEKYHAGSADAVGVSRITVWKALNDREGVPRTKKRIQQKAAEMGLTDTEIQMEKIPEKETGRDEAEERTFSVVVSRPESSAFWMQIIHHIAKELARSRINLMYTYMPSFFQRAIPCPRR